MVQSQLQKMPSPNLPESLTTVAAGTRRSISVSGTIAQGSGGGAEPVAAAGSAGAGTRTPYTR